MRADTHVGPEQMLHIKGLIHCCSSHVRRSWSFRLATHGRAIQSWHISKWRCATSPMFHAAGRAMGPLFPQGAAFLHCEEGAAHKRGNQSTSASSFRWAAL